MTKFWDPNYIFYSDHNCARLASMEAGFNERQYVTAGNIYDKLGLGWSISEETRKQIVWENPKFKDGAILIDYCIDPIESIRIRINNRFDELERRINEIGMSYLWEV